MASPNLGYKTLVETQGDKLTDINDINIQSDNKSNTPSDVAMGAGGGTIVPADSVLLHNFLLRATGTPSSATTLELEDLSNVRNLTLAVENASGEDVTINTVLGVSATSVIVLKDGETAIIAMRGRELTLLGSIGSGLGSSFGKKTKYISVKDMEPSVTKGCSAMAVVEGTAGRPNVHVRDFDSGASVTLEEAQFQFAFPNRWNKGTITYQTYHTHVGGQTGGLDGVAWGLSGVQIADDAAWDVVTGTEVVVTLDRATANEVHKSAASAAVTIAGTLADEDMVFFIIRRVTTDGADDMDIDARLMGIRIFWTEDSAVDD